VKLSVPGRKIARFGLFEADLDRRLLTKDGLRVKLQHQPFLVLTMLLARPGEVIARDEIRQELWPADTYVEFDDGLNTAVKKLRLALSDTAENPRFIETVPRRGYRFLAPVAFPASPDAVDLMNEPVAAASGDAVVAVRERSRLVIEDRSSPYSRIWAYLLLLALLVPLVFVFYRYGRSRSRGAEHAKAMGDLVQSSQPRRSIAVLGFRNASGGTERDWISTALGEMLSTELAAGEKLRIVPEENIARNRLELGLADSDSLGSETLSRLGADLGTDIVVLGSYTTMGKAGQERIRLDLRLQDTKSGETIVEEAVAGNETELFELVSMVGSRLRSRLGIAELSSEEAVVLRASLPSNGLAARLFAEGLGRLRVFDGLGARDLLRKAVDADPKYALAHSAVAETWTMLGYDEKAKEEGKKAFDLSDGLSRPDRLFIEGTYHEAAKEWSQAVEIYATLFDSYPDNPDYGLRLASSLTAAGKPKEALVILDKLRQLPLSAEDPRLDIARAEALMPTGDLKQAQAAAAAAADKAQHRGARLLLAKALSRQSGALLDLGDLDRAIAVASEAQHIYSSVGDRFGVADALSVVGSARWYQGSIDEAVRVYESALAVDKEVGNRRGAVEALSYIGAGLADKGDLERARKTFEEAIAISREINAQAGAAGALSEVAWTYLSEGDLPRARKLYEETLEIYRAVGSRTGEGNTLEPLGLLLIGQGELAKADKILAQALKISRETDDKILLRNTLRNFGILAFMQGDNGTARKNLGEAAELAAATGGGTEAAFIKMWMAKVSLSEERAAEAAATLHEVKEEFRKSREMAPAVQASALMIESLLAQGKTAEAEKEAESGKELAHRSPFVEEGLQFRTALARTDVARGRTSTARRELMEVLFQAKSHGFPEDEFEARLTLAKLEVATGSAVIGRAQLETLEHDARARGFLLIARKASVAKPG
jgi:tetratricopeptide (TPR) repeat protein/DNA-binding winged helix-turn-helix (wHTH) protein